MSLRSRLRAAPVSAAVAVLLASALGPASLRPAAAESLATSLRAFVERPDFARATWGVSVQDAATGLVLFETNSHRLLKPASNAKLFTGALALHTLGPDSRLATELIPAGPISRRGVLRGNLVVRGLGDFSLASRFRPDSPTQSLQSVVRTLREAGLRRVDGDLVADDAFFQGPPYGTGWTQDDLRYEYGAEVSALSLDDNVVTLEFRPGAAPGDPVRWLPSPGASYFRIDFDKLVTAPTSAVGQVRTERMPGLRNLRISGRLPAGSEPWKEVVPVPEPALFFVHRLRESLIEAGIPVTGRPRRATETDTEISDTAARVLPSWPARISISSPPMSVLVAGMMKPSQNLYAQMLLLQVGARSTPAFDASPNTPTTEEAGILALRDFLQHAGIPTEEVRLDDGSGLSRSSLVTPSAIVALLRFMDRHPHRDAFLASLPIAGQDGTLRRRLIGTPLAGQLQAKTGSLRYVNTLSGFLVHPEGRRLVFSAMLEAYSPLPAQPSGREALDALVTRLAQSSLPESL